MNDRAANKHEEKKQQNTTAQQYYGGYPPQQGYPYGQYSPHNAYPVQSQARSVEGQPFHQEPQMGYFKEPYAMNYGNTTQSFEAAPPPYTQHPAFSQKQESALGSAQEYYAQGRY